MPRSWRCSKAAGHKVRIHPRRTRSTRRSPSPTISCRDPTSATAPQRLLGALLDADRVFRLFRSSFLGKASPVHFFWGSFDLAVTRFSGRPAPLHPGGIPNLPDDVTREAYSHEVSSAGFWPGGAGGGGEPFFYSYAYPAPEGFGAAKVRAGSGPIRRRLSASSSSPYDAVSADSDLLDFLETTYAAAADLARWDRAALECERWSASESQGVSCNGDLSASRR